LNDVLLEAEELLEQLPEAVSQRKVGERLAQAIRDLGNADHQLQRMSALIATAEVTEFGKQPHQAEALDEMVDCAQTVGEALENAQDAEALRKAMFEYSNDLNQAITTLQRSIRAHWGTVASDRFQPLIGLGELLESMNVPNNLGGRLIACGRQAMTVSSAGSAPELQAAIGALLSEYDVLQAERAAEIGNDEVGEFINALAEKRATLAMVTPQVREWLVGHGALDRLGVTTR
jgi:hypothetical protein